MGEEKLGDDISTRGSTRRHHGSERYAHTGSRRGDVHPTRSSKAAQASPGNEQGTALAPCAACSMIEHRFWPMFSVKSRLDGAPRAPATRRVSLHAALKLFAMSWTPGPKQRSVRKRQVLRVAPAVETWSATGRRWSSMWSSYHRPTRHRDSPEQRATRSNRRASKSGDFTEEAVRE